MFCKSVGCGDLKLVGVCGWAEHLGEPWLLWPPVEQKKKKKKKNKKKKKKNIVSRKSSFSLMSLSHTHKHLHAHTLFLSVSLSLSLSLSLSSISLFILLFCLSFYWILAGCCNGSLFYLFCVFVYYFYFAGRNY